MSTLQQIMSQVLVEVNDPSQVTYLQPEVVKYINYGYRLMRRVILEVRPRLLMEQPLTGSLSGETITFPKSFMRLVDVKYNHKQIFEVVSSDNRRNNINEWINHSPGRYGFVIMGFNTIRITPKPDQSYPYYIEWVAGHDQDLNLEDDTGYNLEIEDMIIEFVSVRCGIRNGADVKGEMAIMTHFREQILENIGSIGGPRRSTVKGW